MPYLCVPGLGFDASWPNENLGVWSWWLHHRKKIKTSLTQVLPSWVPTAARNHSPCECRLGLETREASQAGTTCPASLW